jgi:hypothetical protein
MKMLTPDELDAIQRAEIRARLAAPTVSELITRACVIYGLTREAFFSESREMRPVRARHWVFYHALDGGRASSVDVGRRAGGLDHSSVLYGAARHAARHRLPSVTEYASAKLARSQEPVPLYEGPEPTEAAPFGLDAVKARLMAHRLEVAA